MKYLLPALLLMAGCGSLHEHYVEADRMTHDALRPSIENWIAEDPLKEDYLGLLRSWEARIARAEASLNDE